MSPVYFPDAIAFRSWLERKHETAHDLTLAIYRKGCGKKGVTYAEALDEALCFGWIDGLRKNLDANTYTIRFGPRKRNSIWSRVNVAHMERLTQLGRVQPAGRRAFAARTAARTGIYSFENRPKELPKPLQQQFKKQPGAWTFFNRQPPGYRRLLIWWIVSAKQAATQQRRLAHLMAESGVGHRLDLMSPFRAGKRPPKARGGE